MHTSNPSRWASLSVLILSSVALGQHATLRLESTHTELVPGQQFIVRAFIDDLPVELHAYQVGLTITGGTSGEITAVQDDGSVEVEEGRADWVFREIDDANHNILTATDMRFPPRLLAIVVPVEVGTRPTNERYLGTFLLEASDDAAGEFQIGITPTDWPDAGERTILITTGRASFPADVDDPSVIPISTAPFALAIQSGTGAAAIVPTTGDWGVVLTVILVAIVGILRMRQQTPTATP